MFEQFVKAVFLTIMGSTVALFLYWIIFGQSLGNYSPFFVSDPNTEKWEGVLFYAAEAVETPISRYYYDYCYTPSIMEYSYMDSYLGLKVDSTSLKNTDLSGYTDSNNVAVYSDGASGTNSSSVAKYSTGWK